MYRYIEPRQSAAYPLVQDAALDTDTVARVTTKLYSAARPLRAAQHLAIDPFSTPRVTII